MRYVVEAIGKPRTDFGESLHNFCDGSIKESESNIKEENGFTNIGYANNPMDFVLELERTGKKPKDFQC